MKISQKVLALFLVIASIMLVQCGENESVTESSELLKKRSIYDGDDNLLSTEDYFYEDGFDAQAGHRPSRVETREPDQSGNMVVIKLEEAEYLSKVRRFLEVQYDSDSKEELYRKTITEQLTTIDNKLVVKKREVAVEKGSLSSEEVSEFVYDVIEGRPEIVEQKLIVNSVPEKIETFSFNDNGLVGDHTTKDGDGNIKRQVSYDWKNDSFEEEVFNDAGKKTHTVSGTMTVLNDRIFRLESITTGAVTERELSCDVKSKKLSCDEQVFDKISGEKTGENSSEVIIADKSELDRPVENRFERFDDNERLLLVEDDWNYRSDKQVEKQSHQVVAKGDDALELYAKEFDELYDFERLLEYNEFDKPIRERKDTARAELSRLILFEY